MNNLHTFEQKIHCTKAVTFFFILIYKPLTLNHSKGTNIADNEYGNQNLRKVCCLYDLY